MKHKCKLAAPFLMIVILATPGAWANTPEPAPLRYYLGHEVVVVDVVTRNTTTRRIETLEGEEPKKKCTTRHRSPEDLRPELCITRSERTTREGTVAAQLVPDPKLSADISLASSAFTDDRMSVELRDGMLLKSINVNSTGQAGNVLTTIAKLAGALLGGGGLFASTDLSVPPMRVSPCEPFDAPLADFPDTVRLFVWENQEACDEWRDIRRLQKEQRERLAARQDIEHKIRGASGAVLRDLLDRLEATQGMIEVAAAELNQRQEQFGLLHQSFVESLSLGSSSVTRHHEQVLDLPDLISSEPLPGTPIGAGLAEAAVDQIMAALPDKKEVGNLWTKGRVIITFDPQEPITCPKDGQKVPNGGAPEAKNVVNIYFRQGSPARMRVFIADQTENPGKSQLRLVADRFDNFVHTCSPVSAMRFKTSAWANRELSLTFDAKGRPYKLERNTGSDAAAIAASLTTSATTFRDEVATSVAKVAEVQENRRKIAMDDLTRQLEKLKGEKEVLDAQLALDSAGANFELSLKQRQAAAELDLLEADLALSAAEETAAQQQEIDALKLTVEQLQQEVLLVKAQQELAKLNQ